MVIQSIKMDSRGRITIPDDIRKTLDLEAGDILYIKANADSFTVYKSARIKIET